LSGHKGTIRSLQFSQDSQWLLTAGEDRTALIWRTDRSISPKELKGGHTGAIYSASFNPNGTRVATASIDGTIRLWDAETTKELVSLRWHSEGVNSVEFSPDGKWILSASDDGSVNLGRCEACALTVEELRQRVLTLAKLPDPELIEIQGNALSIMHPFSFLKTLWGDH
jgi:WD40 repeat protein